MNNNTDEKAPSLKMENMDGDKITDSDLSKEATDVFKIKALELLEKLQVELEEIKETYRREVEVRNTEREEHIKREREMLKNYDELRKQMQLWPLQTRNTRRRPIAPGQALPVRNSEMILSGSSQEDQTENIDESDEFDLEEYLEVPDLEDDYAADDEIEESNEDEQEEIEEDDGIGDNNEDEQREVEEDDETEDNNAEEQEEMEDPEEIEEDGETEGNNAEEQDEMEDPEEIGGDESVENVLEYTPVASEMELPNSTRRTENVKRKASSLLEADNSKKQRLTLVECPVCQESLPEMTRSGKILLLAPKCGHVLCSNCAMRIWSQRQKRCPTCNTLYNIDKLLPVYL